MNFQEFVGAAEVHLRMAGWLMRGHNGVWRHYKKGGDTGSLPLPGAIVAELQVSNIFGPTVERYLTANGWRRTSSGVSTGWATYMKKDKTKKLPDALLRQLMDDRMTNSVVAPVRTPEEMKSLLTVVRPHRSSPPPSGQANTAPARR